MSYIFDPADAWDARRLIAERAARALAEPAAPCPACGAPSKLELINVSTIDGPRYVPGYVSCSARCYTRDPDAYLAAMEAMKGPRQ